MNILAGDIGGTKTRLALFDSGNRRLRERYGATYSSLAYSGFEDVLTEFLHRAESQCQRACFGVAGPISGRRVRTTNLPWVIDADQLEQRFGFDRVTLMNDLEAVAWGVPTVSADDLKPLNVGSRQGGPGNAALIAAGTGLGEAGLYWDGRQLRPFACEGGHASFSPTTEEEWALRTFLSRAHGHVSWERVVSGPGLAAIHEFLCERAGSPDQSRLSGPSDPAAAVVAAAGGEGSRTARDAVRLFVRLYGAEAGNLALKVMAVGGVFVAGGIAPKIIDWLEDGGFMQGFIEKGRMRPLLEAMPVHVILDDRIALKGAARRALEG